MGRKRLVQPPQRDKNPRQPPAWPCEGLSCSANSSLTTGSSSVPGSSGGRTIGVIGGTGDGPDLPRSLRARNSGAAVGPADPAGGAAGGAAVIVADSAGGD